MKTFFKIIVLFALLISFNAVGQTTILDYQFTTGDEAPWNTLVTDVGPYGNSEPLLRTIGDGYNGFYIEDIGLDYDTTYRFSFWAKLTEVNPEYFGGWIRPKDASGNILSDGIVFADQSTDNGVFLFSDAGPILPQTNEWYLFVGFVKSNTDGFSYSSAVYDAAGTLISNMTNQNTKWNTNVVQVDFRAVYVYSAPTSNYAYIFNPKIVSVSNGDDSVSDLLPNSSNPNVSSVWDESNTVASYQGEVAIGRTTVPSGYKLAVEGHIRAREIKVDTDTWPDYVFSSDYQLLTLEEIQKHIAEKGHLPNIPSAVEIAEDGLDLGEMNKLLLEKIEELTLHLIAQEKKQMELENELENLKSNLK